MLLKSSFVYHKQFLITLANTVTIHKCQGLSFDCGIVDLSDSVFCAGMPCLGYALWKDFTYSL